VPTTAGMTTGEPLTPTRTVIQHRAMRALAVLSMVWLAACTRPAPGVCCTSPDDCHSIGADENERPCDMGLVCTDHMCTVPPPPPPGCQSDMDCGGITPFCAPDHTCVGCLRSDQCPANAPTCDATTSVCRACAGDDECSSHVCDLKSGVCIAEA